MFILLEIVELHLTALACFKRLVAWMSFRSSSFFSRYHRTQTSKLFRLKSSSVLKLSDAIDTKDMKQSIKPH